MILISCIVPMYNSAKTIIRALESIKSQTYKGKLQIIVVDDGSIDSSFRLVSDFKMENSELWIDLLMKTNGGVSSARNEGMKCAQGDYISFLDSDDVWLSEKLEVQFESMVNNPIIDLLGCRTNTIVQKKSFVKSRNDLIPLVPFGYVIETQLITSTVFFKREIYERIGGFDESMKYAEDMNYWLRSMEYFKCFVLNTPLVYMEENSSMKHSGGLSNKLWAMEKGELKNIKYIYKKGHVNYGEYIFATVFSFLKYIRRVVLQKYI